MQGSWNNDAACYLSMFLSQYAAHKISHPRAATSARIQFLPGLDGWLATIFAPEALPWTVQEHREAQDVGMTDVATGNARRVIADCDAKLLQHRVAPGGERRSRHRHRLDGRSPGPGAPPQKRACGPARASPP